MFHEAATRGWDEDELRQLARRWPSQDAPGTHQLSHMAAGEHLGVPRIGLCLRPATLSYDHLRHQNHLWEQGVASSNLAVPIDSRAPGCDHRPPATTWLVVGGVLTVLLCYLKHYLRYWLGAPPVG
jgi:hypothetical protein